MGRPGGLGGEVPQMSQLALRSLGSLGPLQFALSEQAPLLLIFMSNPEMPFIPLACLSANEVELFRQVVGLGKGVLADLPVGQGSVLGQTLPQPRLLQLAVAREAAGEEMLLVRILDGFQGISEMAFNSQVLGELESLFESATQVLGSLPWLSGMVEKVDDATVQLQLDGGSSCQAAVVPELSRIVGDSSQPLASVELLPGDRVRCAFSGATLLWAERVGPEPLAPPTCPIAGPGQQGDALAFRGQLHQGFECHLMALEEIGRRGEVNAYQASKLTLGLLYRKVLARQWSEAHSLLSKQREHPIFRPGVETLESARVPVSLPDLLLFQWLKACVYAHDPGKRGEVQNWLDTTYQLARTEVPGHWAIYLRNGWLMGRSGLLGEHWEARWQLAARDYPEHLAPRALHFPAPQPWRT